VIWSDLKVVFHGRGPDILEEVRLRDLYDPEKDHHWGYMWAPGEPVEIDLSSYVRTIHLRPEDLDA
jgi:hypothetical protein